jgi:hypothetical protein
MVRRRVQLIGLALVVWSVLGPVGDVGAQAPVPASASGGLSDSLPAQLSDAEFWALSEKMSEPDGYFRSDNLLSNELYYPEVLDELTRRVGRGGVYLGVGPEQNFNYIVAVRPQMAFITDVRRGNLQLHLLYKALFELSADRVEFVSRLFTKPRPTGLGPASSASDIMNAYWVIDTSARDVFDANVRAVQQHLTTTRHLPLSQDDLDAIADIYLAFYWHGPSITYSSSSNSGFGRGGRMANYHQLMVAADEQGTARSYLATEDAFLFVKQLEARNLIVPVVGDFGGPRALRTVGQFVRDKEATISMFYLSNVEQYLRQSGTHPAFCANVASMPLGAGSTFVRSQSGAGGFRNMIGGMRAETAACAVPDAAPISTWRPGASIPGAR